MKTRTKIFIFIAIITGVMAFQLFLPNFGRTQHMRMELIGGGITYDFGASPSFHSNSSASFFYSTRSVVQYRTTAGDGRASQSHSFNPTLTRPIMIGRGDIVAVGEENGRRVYVFGTEGLILRKEFDDIVSVFSVTESGLLSVVLRQGTGHEIRVYNRTGELLYLRFIREAMRIPIAVETSYCGRYVVVAIMNLSTMLTTYLEFGYINTTDGVDLLDTHAVFFTDIFNDHIVTSMRFMADNKLVSFTTAGVICYQLVPNLHGPTRVNQIFFYEKDFSIDNVVFYGDRHFAYVTGSRHMWVTEGPIAGTVRIYNINGTRTGEFFLGRRATHLSAGHGAILVGADRNFHAVTLNGNHLWEHNALQDATGRDVIFLGNTNTILISGPNRADILERRRARDTELENTQE